MEQGLVSIIVPVYNREGLIKDTLNSLIRQTYHHWECIIVDDGSTDNTIKTVIYYCKKDNRFKLKIRNKKPKGAPSCRNLGLKEALGEFLIFLDSDDILLPNAIESRVNYLQANRQIDFCVSNGIKGVYPIDKKKSIF